MANQILINPFPFGVSNQQQWQTLEGTIALAGSAVATGEPLNWGDLISGIGYNEINFTGNGVHGNGTALVTTLSGDGTTVTATAANNFSVGQVVKFKGCTTAMGLLLNGVSVTIVTASATQFTFLNASNTTGTSEVGLAVVDKTARPILQLLPSAQAIASVTALSATGSVLTVTAANALLPGASVVVSVATGTLGPLLAGLSLPVIQSTGTAFTATMPSALSGTTGTGTAVGYNPPQPFSLRFWSALASGYTYQYKNTFGTLFTMVGGASASLPQAPLAAAAYPAGVLADVIKFSAKFTRS